MTEALSPKGEYVDRKRTLPKRVVPLSLHLTRLTAGRHLVIVEVDRDGMIKFESATLTEVRYG